MKLPFFAGLARVSLSVRILIGLGLGIVAGVLFGEGVTVLQPVAEIYIRLMQMTVLPYLILSLVIGFGQLEVAEAKLLARKGGVLLLMTWLGTCAVIVAMPLTFPDFESASFYSSALVEPPTPFSVAELYFTSNPFHSLSNAVVPAIVLFSSAVGISLIGLTDREQVLAPLRVANTAIVRITRFVGSLTPIGVLAIGAQAAGTVTWETLERLQVYFVVVAVASLLLTFLILPLMVTALTPFRYGELLALSRDILLTAFVANSAFIVLPMIVERAKALMRRHGLLVDDSDPSAEILVPIVFNFPNAGRLITMLFLPFAAWLAGSSLQLEDYGMLFGAGLPTYFAKAQVALPFLIDLFSLPHDLFQLYIPTTLLGGKFDSMVTAMNLMVFALVGAAAMRGFLEIRRRRIAGGIVASAAGIVGAVLITRAALAATTDNTYDLDEALRSMHIPRGGAVGAVHRDAGDIDPALPAPGESRWDLVRQRGTLRVGYDPENLPFSFFNADGQLVGLDVELAAEMAAALQVTPEFVPVSWTELGDMLDTGVIDVMPTMWYRPFWFRAMRLSEPYLTGTMGLAVRDSRRGEFVAVEDLRRSRGLRIGVPLDMTQVRYSLDRYFGGTDAQFVTVEKPAVFFEGEAPPVDAFVVPAENGSAWTLLHPEYSIVVPQPDPVRIPYAFGVARDAEELLALIDEWVTFARSEGTLRRAQAYWVLGQGAQVQGPRWSILRDVLGWIE